MSGTYKSDGGQAFPSHYPKPDPNDCTKVIHDEGMTLRDYFAGKAFPVLLAELYAQAERSGSVYEVPVYKVASTAAYEAADAMLEAREK